MFKTESDLITEVEKNKTKFATKRSECHLLKEFNIGSGITDVIIVNLNKKTFEQRNKRSPYLVNKTDELVILSILYKKTALSLKTISKRSGLNEKKVLKILNCLSNKKLVRVNDNKVSLEKHAQPVFHSLISIEGKLKNWKQAMVQAYRNSLFSNQSYVAMDSNRFKVSDKKFKNFVDSNVGLLLMNATKDKMRISYTPKKYAPTSPFYTFLASEKILAILTGR